MDGILFVIDDQSRKRFVQIDLDKHGALWEDFYDLLVAWVRGHALPHQPTSSS